MTQLPQHCGLRCSISSDSAVLVVSLVTLLRGEDRVVLVVRRELLNKAECSVGPVCVCKCGA